MSTADLMLRISVDHSADTWRDARVAAREDDGGLLTMLKLNSKNWRYHFLQLQTGRAWGYVHDIYIGQARQKTLRLNAT
jgi:hypothetical protein